MPSHTKVCWRFLFVLFLPWLVAGCAVVEPTLKVLWLARFGQGADHPSSVAVSTPAPGAMSQANRQPRGASTVTPAPGENPLLRLLAFVPNQRDYRQYLTYGDPAAWHESWQVSQPANMEAVERLGAWERGLWLYVAGRQLLYPNALGVNYLLTEDMGDYYGFSLFDVNRFIEAGAPPATITVLESDVDKNDVIDALIQFGYTEDVLVGKQALYSLRDDYAVDVQAKIATGRLGELNRIVLLEDEILIGRATEVVETALSAQAGKRAALADDPYFAAAALALNDPLLADYGELVGAILVGEPPVDDPALLLLGPKTAAFKTQLQKYVERPLSPYLVLGFGTQHIPGATYLSLAVVFPKTVDAHAAADLLADRLQNYYSVYSGDSLEKFWSFHQAAGVEANGLPVALVVMRVADPAQPDDGDSSFRPTLFGWSEMVFRRDLLFLFIGEPVLPE